MASRKKTVRRAHPSEIQRATKRIAKTWDDTREALGTAEAVVEKKVRAFVKKSGVDTRKATEMVAAWRDRVEKERRRAKKQVEARIATLQARAKKERRAMGRRVDDAVQSALGALNIPTRHEVHELTRRVEELSKKIDGFRRAPRPAAPRATA
ncbi:MAG TPA: phasin family protein [Vicinamibacteria bacterium]